MNEYNRFSSDASPEEKYGAFFEAYNEERMQAARDVRRAHAKGTPRHRRRKRRLRWGRFLAVLLCFAILIGILAFAFRGCGKADAVASSVSAESHVTQDKAVNATASALPMFTADTKTVGSDVYSEHVILVDVTNGTVLAQKDAQTRIRPASLIKLMVALVAVDDVSDMSETYTFTADVLTPLYQQDEAIMIGYQEGETATLDDLFHGMLMFSGADAAYGIVDRVSDSTEAFIDKMNAKAAEIGLKDTHFSNVIGLDDDGLYSTCYDMAVLMQQTMKNEYLRNVLSTEDYAIPATESHPDGIAVKNSMFAKMVGNEPEVAQIVGGKTGFTAKAGFCLASFAKTNDGRELIAVTTNANGNYRPIYDAFTLYKIYSVIDD